MKMNRWNVRPGPSGTPALRKFWRLGAFGAVAAFFVSFAPRCEAASLPLYSIGQPTPDEQLYVELINRARANPGAEGVIFRDTTNELVRSAYAFFSVDMALMVSQFKAIAPAPPLAINEKLSISARKHSLDMFQREVQTHLSADGSTFLNRANNEGSPTASIAENVYAFSSFPFEGHAGFEVDWGPSPETGNSLGGMQDPPGHRLNTHNPLFREIGIGLYLGKKGKVGPELITQDYAVARNSPTFITGVAYYDLIKNNFYDTIEGISGVNVQVEGAAFAALTANSGGYSIPVSSNGSYRITFSIDGLPPQQRTVVISNSANVKVDFVPVYAPPQISGPDLAASGRSNTYSFLPVPGAVFYQWSQAQRVHPLLEGAEKGTNNVVLAVSPGYAVVDSGIKLTGNFGFHLATPEDSPQHLTLGDTFIPLAGSRLDFQSRLGVASVDQLAAVQVSTNNGVSWTNVWSQLGTDDFGESAFTSRSVSLSSFASNEVRIRFSYDFATPQGGSFFPQTDPGVGWYLDDIVVVNAEELIQPATNIVTASGFFFAPAVTGDFRLKVRPIFPFNSLDWGPVKTVSAISSTVPRTVRITSMKRSPTSDLELNFELTSGLGGGFIVEKADSPMGPWLADTTVSITALNSTQYKARGNAGEAARHFYRIKAN